ncbi:uncharacterized protein BDW47DRAFT_125025 [Aspergillus candidus]|uniref:CRESS-DNA virus Rep endonuclease domain-containing protein n=1 Tax=Aspergillus candidus TaxID=41067 RepID=A0A2I2FDU1_ASPCN|nr:hypothetical protein BDW47DRAFT_125025 [Aspergillus candidus]PLB38795.1 hypothetical protein BDW47DRAFT_125025 [Aspergillus candidus]
MSVSGDGHEFMEVQKRLGGGKSPGGDEREYDLGKEIDRTLHAKYAFVTFEKSKIHNVEEFHRRFLEKFPTAETFGSREWHEDGTPHYFVVIRFASRVKFSNARKSLLLDGEDGRVVVRVKSVDMSISNFLEGTQAYCARHDNPDTFGTWLKPRDGVKARTKRKYEEVLAESDFETEKRKLRKADPHRFIYQYPAVIARLNAKMKRSRDVRRRHVGRYGGGRGGG